MIGDRVEVERRGHLDLIPRGVLDRLALGKAVGVVGRGGGAEVIGVKGVFGVDMQITDIRIGQRVRGWRCAIQQIHHRLERVASTTTKIPAFIEQTHFLSAGSGQRQQADSENKTFTHNASLSLLLSDREFTRHRLPPAPLIHASTPRSDA